MPVFQKGSINTTALIVPDLYIQIVPPSVSYLNGVPTNILGIVGTAIWGPKNSPVTISSMADYARMFGDIQTSKYDMGTQVAAAVLQGANNIRCVRVTDGTDAGATVAIKDVKASTPDTGCTLTAKYTGSKGNALKVAVANGSKASSYKLTISFPGGVPEIFDNLEGTGNNLWKAMTNAINLGQSGIRGPSELVTAAAGPALLAPDLTQTLTFTGGLDGNTTITPTTLVGSDTTPRTGMYALRNTGCSIALLADTDDRTSWPNQLAFGLSEGIYMILTGPSSEAISAAITAKGTAGIDSYAAKVMFGDWVYFNDTVNGQVRLVSPQGFVAGRLANLSPEQSSLNKPLYGIVGTQKTFANQFYSNAELGQLAMAGIDVIASPAPGGSYYGVRIGHNSSSDPMVNGDNYTRMTNYIAYSLDSGMGKFIGRLQNTQERLEAKGMLESFLVNMEQQGMIGAVNGGPSFQVILDASNNPISRVALGYQQADVKVTYLSIVEKFIINVEGGQSVTVTKQSTQLAR